MALIDKRLLLALDAGTTSVKAGLFSPDGICLASSLQEYTLISHTADEAELDPEVYWQAASHTIREVIRQAGIDPRDVTALAVSSQGETTIALDSGGRPVRNALVWLDNRAVKQAEELKDRLGEGVYDHTGDPEVIPTWTACKILWIKQNEPELFARVHKFLLVQDYLIYRLTGEFVTDGSVSCTSLLYDIVRHDWWGKSLEAVGITAERLARVQSPGTVAGSLTEAAAAELGLPARTRVVCGGMDQSAGAIGAGNITPGVITETTGAALTVQASIPNPAIDRNKKTPVYEHSIAGRYLFVPVCPTGGMVLKWFKDQFGAAELALAEEEGRDAYDLLTETAAAAPPGCDGLVLLPHLMGAFSPDINPLARGVFGGFTLHHTRAHFARAVLEGVACLLRRNLELIGSSGIEIKEVRSTGGGAKSRLWNQIKADVCNLPILLLENEDTALVGDAILAGAACGVYESVADGVAAMVRVKDKIYPGPNASAYQAVYRRYRDLDRTLNDYFTRNYLPPREGE